MELLLAVLCFLVIWIGFRIEGELLKIRHGIEDQNRILNPPEELDG